MTARLITLTKDLSHSYLNKLLAIDRGMMGEPWTADHFLADLPGKWDCSFLSLDDDGHPSGFAIVSLKPPSAHIHRLAVRESDRGQGLGEMLLHHVKERALTHGCTSVTLKVALKNFQAIEFYRRMGFSVKGEFPPNLAMEFCLPSTGSAQ